MSGAEKAVTIADGRKKVWFRPGGLSESGFRPCEAKNSASERVDSDRIDRIDLGRDHNRLKLK